MRILVCIDDTDNLESRGTGELASLLAQHLDEMSWGRASYVTRHQLLIHPDIPFTSHNSSMAFFAEINPDCLGRLTDYASNFLAEESAEGSDPGLCIVNFEQLTSGEKLIAFGLQAKRQVLEIDAAYALAKTLGIHLSAHGGTGQGVIGALAGAGLRLGGNDGRLKGQLKFAGGEEVSVAQLLVHPHVDVVRSVADDHLASNEIIHLQDKVKTVLLEGQSVLLVEKGEDSCGRSCWQNLSRRQLKSY
jgi:hypothetical protein